MCVGRKKVFYGDEIFLGGRTSLTRFEKKGEKTGWALFSPFSSSSSHYQQFNVFMAEKCWGEGRKKRKNTACTHTMGSSKNEAGNSHL